MKSGDEQDGRDSKMVGAYRAASDALDERPSAAARAAILAAAARAVDAQPRDAQTGATSRRAAAQKARGIAPSKRPLAAVASFLVAAVALVLATNVEREPADVASKVAGAPAQIAESARANKADAPVMQDQDTKRTPEEKARSAPTSVRPELTGDVAGTEQDAGRRRDAPLGKVIQPPAPEAGATPAVRPPAPEVQQPFAAPRAPSADAIAPPAPAPAAPVPQSRSMERGEPGGKSLADSGGAGATPPKAQASAPSSPATATDATAPVPSIAAVAPAQPPQAAFPAAPSAAGAPASSPSAPGVVGGLAAANRLSEAEAQRAKEEVALRAAKPALRAAEPAQDARGQATPARVQAPAALPSETRARQLATARPVERTAAFDRDVENDPARWLQRIVALRDAGLDTDADRELARLRERYPELQVPANALRRAGTR